MTPLFFGDSSRRLFGIYTPAHAKAGKQRAIVLCPPWGAEYLRAHRSLCQLGRMLAASGFHVLRFDYFGTGDSAGDMADGNLSGWQSDVQAAVEELKDTAGLLRVSLLGLRLGGNLALRVAAARPRDVDALVLWDPVVDGGEHMAGLRRLDEQVRKPRTRAGSAAELLGFPMTDALAHDLETLNLLEQVTTLPTRTFVAVSEHLASHEALRRVLEANARGPIPMEQMDSLPAWVEDRHSGAGAIPVKVLQRIVEWLS